MPAAIELSSRDYQILWYCWQSRFFSVRQFQRIFWGGSTTQAARARIKRLRDAGLLGCETFPVGRDRMLVFPSLAGNRALIEAGLLSADYARDFPHRPKDMTLNLEHDLRVNDIRIAFEETGSIPLSWVSDHQLRQNRGNSGPNTRFADGLFEWEAQGHRYKGVLEFERMRYNAGRWPDILSRLRGTYDDCIVFLVVMDAARTRSAAAAVKGSKIYSDRPEQFLIADFPSVEAHGLKAGFKDLDGHPFTTVDK
jgi:hypothetical protein